MNTKDSPNSKETARNEILAQVNAKDFLKSKETMIVHLPKLGIKLLYKLSLPESLAFRILFFVSI